MRERIYMVLC